MTIYGTPAGTPLNNTGFQGTQPGNPVQSTLQPVLPGVGCFPPNSNANSGDTLLAAASRGAVPANVNITNFGVPGSGNKPVAVGLGGAGERGTNAAFVANGGSANNGPNGTGNAQNAAGGMAQANGATGEATILPANVPASLPVYGANPSYRG